MTVKEIQFAKQVARRDQQNALEKYSSVPPTDLIKSPNYAKLVESGRFRNSDDYSEYVNFWQGNYPASVVDYYKRWLFVLNFSPVGMRHTVRDYLAAYGNLRGKNLDPVDTKTIRNWKVSKTFDQAYWTNTTTFNLISYAYYSERKKAAIARLELLGLYNNLEQISGLLLSLMYPLGSHMFCVPVNVATIVPEYEFKTQKPDSQELTEFMHTWTLACIHRNCHPAVSFYYSWDRAVLDNKNTDKEIKKHHDYTLPTYWGRVFDA